MNQTKSCRNCKYCLPSIYGKRFDKCKKNSRTWDDGGFAYCSILKSYHMLFDSCTDYNLIHWEPKPSIKEQFYEFIDVQREKIKRLDDIFDEYWKKFIELIK